MDCKNIHFGCQTAKWLALHITISKHKGRKQLTKVNRDKPKENGCYTQGFDMHLHTFHNRKN